MSPANRIASFGAAGLMVAFGAVCAVVSSGEVGQILAMVLIGLGLILATALVFLEVGLSEDRERAEEKRTGEQAREERQRARRLAAPSRRLRRPSLGRSRDHRRRLS
jgi:hypothetical protein